jgi:phosphoenolpyruvate synthase/pyruvate phosphate dikinase
MSLIVYLDQPEGAPVSLVGGKGSNLLAMTAAGFPVPPGFIVTADAYQLFLDAIADLDAELSALAYDQPERLREQCVRLRGRLGQIPLPASVMEAIQAGLTRLGVEGAFAVRSSSTFEDLAQAAFAGQHDTFLNVRGAAAIMARVRDCFVSLWQDRAVLYRKHQGFSQTEARMAVVVQQQIACARAGVGFSIQPITGRLDRIVIDANYGLGESVVAGECEVDHFELDKESLRIEQCAIGHKDRMVVPTETGVDERAIPPEQRDMACLTDDQVRALAGLVKKVEAHYAWPQDVEWGWCNGQFYLLQARPVTTFQPRWTRDESAERFPRPMTPLSWDFLQVAFRRSMGHSLALMGLPPMQGDWFQWFDHYIYGNQNAVALIASYRPLRARSPQELAAEIPALRRRYSWVLELPVRWARNLDRYLIRLGQLSAVPLDTATLPEIWAHITRTLDVATEYFQPNIAISMTQAFLHRLLHALTAMVTGPDRALAVVDGLLAGCDTKTAVVNRELHELAQMASRQCPAIAELLRELGGRGFLERHELERFPEFAARFQRFLEDHGHREMDMDYYHPTWIDQPAIVLDAIALILRGTPEDPDETARKLRVRYADTEHEFLSRVPAELRFFFRELVRLARTYTSLDDLEHYQTTRVNPLARRAALALGRRMQERGIIDSPEEIFFFKKSELEELAATYPHEDRQRFRAIGAAGKRAYQASLERTPSWVLEESAPPSVIGDTKVQRGLPGSPGRVTGPCFLVFDPSDFGRFPKGAILVARTTNPAWTPLFYSAAGLITESGGPLSHGAVTAREMALPAVMSVRNVMTILRNGDKVTVDGTQGVVRLETPDI